MKQKRKPKPQAAPLHLSIMEGSDGEHDALHLMQDGQGYMTFVDQSGFGYSAEGLRRAALIVRAVNAHETLVALIRERIIENCTCQHFPRKNPMASCTGCDDARAALRAAGEEV